MQERSLALFRALAAEMGEPGNLEWAREARGDHPPLRPLPAPQRDPRPRVDARGDRVPARAGLVVLTAPQGASRKYNRRVETIELALALVLAVAAIGALARWTPLPLPMLLVVGGAALSFLPGLSDVELDPDVFFLLFVPLLLFGDGWQFPKREFVSYLRPILLLALGLVAATVVVVGYRCIG